MNAATKLPDQRLCEELITIYFDLFHDKQHALFHVPTFIAEQRQGNVPVFLVLGIMAIAARFVGLHRLTLVFTVITDSRQIPTSTTSNPGTEGELGQKLVKTLFDRRPEAVTLSSLQGCALLGNLAFIEGDAGLESLYGAQAIRMAQLLDLPRRLSKNQIQRETEIRGTSNVRLRRLTADNFSLVDHLDDGHLDVCQCGRSEATHSQTRVPDTDGRDII